MKTVDLSTPLRVNGEQGRTIKFFTLGCKVNQYDTQVMRESLLRAGFKEITKGNRADFYLINTCTVTKNADRESRYLIRYARRNNPQAKILVYGCYAESNHDEIAKINGVNFVLRGKEKNRIIEILNYSNVRNALAKDNGLGTISGFPGHVRAFLKIQDGCDNFCSYCKVPFVRGEPRSKPLENIIKEAEGLIKRGFKEIVLCGICLGQYGRDLTGRINLGCVIKSLENLPGLLRIRLSSIEAGDISDELINKISKSKKFCRHLHIPIQSGDDAILKAMNRSYLRKDYLGLIRRIRNKIPGIAITTDVLVGFPGESEKAFKNTVDLVRKIHPLKAHIFPYSPREGTAAFSLKDRVCRELIKKRILVLGREAERLSHRYKEQFLNRNMDVLLERRNKKNPAFWLGHTDNYIQVLAKSGKEIKNRIVRLKLKKIIGDYVVADFC
ncbi:MAG: tRNA (N(6)-L-threonylcarbamoyladenosine(37)-C(2))-methylthiotransferase MtaB [Candidatus Omnitrophota bacterium]